MTTQFLLYFKARLLAQRSSHLHHQSKRLIQFRPGS
ncbi:hypothetical protein Bhyg_08861 [Pseudolycoriella hygida]|uniref:Uncharacterized protein n=1 Tax=Pseudolycoriella hygida TaxID=35572 RepID=A0A9Q0N6P6_9DIPT|nr:hypothetical protein Bhyg_08861 [Pseudolycoriella hygida]